MSDRLQSAKSNRSMEQARATASDLPAGQIQAHLFAEMALKAYVEAAALDIDSTPRSSPSDSTSDVLTQSNLTMRLSCCSSLLGQVLETRARGQIFRAQRPYEACSHRPTEWPPTASSHV